MGRPRATKKDGQLPPYVYRKQKLNLIEYRPYLGNGKSGKSVYLRDADGNLLPFTASISEIIRAYARVIDATPVERTLSWLLDAYFKSPRATRLAPKTLKDYRHYAGKIIGSPLSNGRTFGEVPLSKITRPVIARYRDSLADTPILANRHLQFLSAVFSWGLEQGYVVDNQAQGVEKNPSPPRKRYVQDHEYETAYRLAPEWLKAAMEIAYLCRARRGEVLGMPVSAVLPEGLLLDRLKGSKSEVIRWSPRLRAAVDMAKAHNRTTISPWLLHTPQGQQIATSAFNSAWRRLMGKLEAEGVKPFPFHDLKARGYSDTDQGAGHKSARMHEVYQRKPEEKEATK